MIVGGYAVMRYTEPRFTKGLDLWVEAGTENAERVFKALADFGAPLGSKHDNRKPSVSSRASVLFRFDSTLGSRRVSSRLGRSTNPHFGVHPCPGCLTR